LAGQTANDRLGQIDQAAEILGIVKLAQPGAVARRQPVSLGSTSRRIFCNSAICSIGALTTIWRF
jgi:hypothetical protein